MKSVRKELWFNVPRRRQFINITPEVETAVRDSGIREGLCLVNAMHGTARCPLPTTRAASITISKPHSEKLAPEKPRPWNSKASVVIDFCPWIGTGIERQDFVFQD
jgi:thiamine phosphate synthase YjbQ (UPF0047 family)